MSSSLVAVIRPLHRSNNTIVAGRARPAVSVPLGPCDSLSRWCPATKLFQTRTCAAEAPGSSFRWLHPRMRCPSAAAARSPQCLRLASCPGGDANCELSTQPVGQSFGASLLEPMDDLALRHGAFLDVLDRLDAVLGNAKISINAPLRNADHGELDRLVCEQLRELWSTTTRSANARRCFLKRKDFRHCHRSHPGKCEPLARTAAAAKMATDA